MYRFKIKVLRLIKGIGLFVICFMLSSLVAISQREIIDPDEMLVNKSILVQKTEEAESLEIEVNSKKANIDELQKIVDKKSKEIEDKKSKEIEEKNKNTNKTNR